MKLFNLLFALGLTATTFATDEIPTKVKAKGDVVLIFTATSDNTKFSIVDRNEEGNSNVIAGTLMKGQSYVKYVQGENISDEAVTNSNVSILRDGNYFLNSFENLLYTSLTTNVAWQENFVPSIDKKSYGKSFYLFTPSNLGQKQNINVIAYNEKTKFKIYKISNQSTSNSGFTSVDLKNKKLVLEKQINPGEDLIQFCKDGIQLLEGGCSYYVEADNDISVQFGAQKLKEKKPTLSANSNTEMAEIIAILKDNNALRTYRNDQRFYAEMNSKSENYSNTIVSAIKSAKDDRKNKVISKKEKNLYVFPNEQHTKVVIDTKNSKTEEKSILIGYSVLDKDGVEKLSGRIAKNTLAIVDLSTLDKGKYKIVATDKEGQKYAGKITKP